MFASTATATIFVIDDEKSVRDSIKWLFNSISLQVKTFDSAQAFLDDDIDTRYGCLISDVRMQNLSGLQLLDILHELHFPLPVILLSAYGDAQMGARAIKKGAVDFLQKPYRNQDLLDAVNVALRLSKEALDKQSERKKYLDWLGSLSQREKETLDLVVTGKSSKEIARTLGISHKTVEAHRARVMRKLGAKSSNDLIHLAIMNNSHCRGCQWLSLPSAELHCRDSAAGISELVRN
jgi:two-component system response regulator TtrR